MAWRYLKLRCLIDGRLTLAPRVCLLHAHDGLGVAGCPCTYQYRHQPRVVAFQQCIAYLSQSSGPWRKRCPRGAVWQSPGTEQTATAVVQPRLCHARPGVGGWRRARPGRASPGRRRAGPAGSDAPDAFGGGHFQPAAGGARARPRAARKRAQGTSVKGAARQVAEPPTGPWYGRCTRLRACAAGVARGPHPTTRMGRSYRRGVPCIDRRPGLA